VERTERPHELPELDDTVPLEVKQIEHPVGEEIRSFAGPEQGELEFLLHRDTIRPGDDAINCCCRRSDGKMCVTLWMRPSPTMEKLSFL
jgi:hypothetical protein